MTYPTGELRLIVNDVVVTLQDASKASILDAVRRAGEHAEFAVEYAEGGCDAQLAVWYPPCPIAPNGTGHVVMWEGGMRREGDPHEPLPMPVRDFAGFLRELEEGIREFFDWRDDPRDLG